MAGHDSWDEDCRVPAGVDKFIDRGVDVLVLGAGDLHGDAVGVSFRHYVTPAYFPHLVDFHSSQPLDLVLPHSSQQTSGPSSQ